MILTDIADILHIGQRTYAYYEPHKARIPLDYVPDHFLCHLKFCYLLELSVSPILFFLWYFPLIKTIILFVSIFYRQFFLPMCDLKNVYLIFLFFLDIVLFLSQRFLFCFFLVSLLNFGVFMNHAALLLPNIFVLNNTNVDLIMVFAKRTATGRTGCPAALFQPEHLENSIDFIL